MGQPAGLEQYPPAASAPSQRLGKRWMLEIFPSPLLVFFFPFFISETLALSDVFPVPSRFSSPFSLAKSCLSVR